MISTEQAAFKVVKKLVENGYTAYYAGGWVRDYIMGNPSDDIDIATDAHTEDIIRLFDITIPVGIAFGSVIVVFEKHQFEVSSFRSDGPYYDGRHPETVSYSSPEVDAQRRDFTINGMFYDPLKKEIIDYVHGREDIDNKIIRTIGDANERFAEDRLRMIRAVRFAVRFGFPIEKKTKQSIVAYSSTLFPAVAIERIWQEFNKMVKDGFFAAAIKMMFELGLLSTIFPQLESIEEAVSRLEKFPFNCPTILWVMELFAGNDLEEQINLCDYLKVSREDKRLVEYVYQGQRLISSNDVEDVSWAHFYAHKDDHLCLDILSLRYKDSSFMDEHQQRKNRLQSHIERIITKNPVVKAKDLLDRGVKPGKTMGLLLKEAERISVNNNILDAESVIRILQKSFLWPK